MVMAIMMEVIQQVFTEVAWQQELISISVIL